MSTSEKKDKLVKITYETLKEKVNKQYTRFEEIEDLVYIFAQLRAGGAPVSLDWANGVVFVYSALAPDTEQIMEEYLKGRVYWANVTFAAMPVYKPILETKEKIQVPIINLSSNPIIRHVTEWLKQQN